MRWLIAAPAAIVAAACFGTAGFLQHRAARQAPPSAPLRLRLLRDLMRIPAFRWGVILGAAGFILQVVALRFAPLAVVQPLLVTGVLFYLACASLFLHTRPDNGLLLGAVLALLGLIGFLIVAQPTSGSGDFEGTSALPLGVGLVIAVGTCLYVASRLSYEIRALPLAVATAVCYGVTAGLLRSLLVSSPTLGSVFGQWQLYAVAVVGPAGFLLNQNAFQEGRFGSVAVATITVGDPIVGIGIGLAWFGDRLAGGPGRITAEVLLLGLMAGGIVLLTGRAQRVGAQLQGAPREQATP